MEQIIVLLIIILCVLACFVISLVMLSKNIKIFDIDVNESGLHIHGKFRKNNK